MEVLPPLTDFILGQNFFPFVPSESLLLFYFINLVFIAIRCITGLCSTCFPPDPKPAGLQAMVVHGVVLL